MTPSDFLAYKYTLYNYASEMASKLYSDAMTGRNTVGDDFFRLKSLLVFIRIMNEYELNESELDDQNMFVLDEMEIVINHLNKLCGTNYNIDLNRSE